MRVSMWPLVHYYPNGRRPGAREQTAIVVLEDSALHPQYHEFATLNVFTEQGVLVVRDVRKHHGAGYQETYFNGPGYREFNEEA